MDVERTAFQKKASIVFHDRIPVRPNSYSTTFKDMEGCVSIQLDACPDYQNSAVIMVYFLDRGRQEAGSRFSPPESTSPCGEAESG